MAIRILYIITKSNWGGAQRYVYNLAVAAREQGYDVAVAVGGAGMLTEKLTAASIRVIPLPLRQRKTFLLDVLTFAPLFSLIRLLHIERPDIVHTNSAKAGGLGNLAARLANVPRILFTAHGWEFNAPRSFLSKAGIRFFSWLTILLSHTTICVSEAIRRDIGWMPWTRSKLVVIHNGVRCESLLPREEARRALCPQTRAIFWIGMLSELHPTKRIEDAIRAFSLIAPRHPESGLCIISEGAERTKLEHLIRDLQLEKHVFLVGFVKEAPRYLSAFDLFVHSSQSEAFSLVLLEAGCAGLPVVATDVGGIPEVIHDGVTGLLVPARNPKRLAEAIETLLAHPEKAELFAAALAKRVRAEFTLEQMLTQTICLYTSP